MLDLTLARQYLRDRLPKEVALTDGAANRALVRGFNRLWRHGPWKFSETRDQFTTYADYDTGGVLTLTNGSKAVTFTGTALTQVHVGRHLRIGTDMRDYEIDSVLSGTSATIQDAYEGTSITVSTAYRISQKIYRLPWNCASVISFKDNVVGQEIPLITRREFERGISTNNVTGNVEYFVEAGYTTKSLYSTGTLALDENNTAVVGTSTAFDARMVGRRLVVQGYPYTLKIKTVTDGTNLVLDSPWPFEDQPLALYSIDPPGVPLVEAYPVSDNDASISVFYHRLPPDVVNGHDAPPFPPEFDDLWIDCTLASMGIMDEGLVEKRLGDLADAEGIMRGGPYQLGSYGGGPTPTGGIRLSSHTAAVPWYEE